MSSRSTRSFVPIFVLSWVSLLLLTPGFAVPAFAQDVPVISPTEDLDFDRPEAWAMKHFASLSLLTGMGAPQARQVGSVELGFEAGWIPNLSAEERTVGFAGTKEEDLNKLSAFGRLRATFGLPHRFALTAGWVPPVEINGVKANLISLALERSLLQRGAWALGLRLYGQTGDIEGDFTCGDRDLESPPGEPGNEFGCEERSQDTYDLVYGGVELNGSYLLSGQRSPRLHLGLAANVLDMEFQVDAVTFGFRDRTRLRTDGWTYSMNAGADWYLGGNTGLVVELFYSPLDVIRPPRTAPRGDDLLNLRLMVRHRLR